jgi:hypothetical protein
VYATQSMSSYAGVCRRTRCRPVYTGISPRTHRMCMMRRRGDINGICNVGMRAKKPMSLRLGAEAKLVSGDERLQ